MFITRVFALILGSLLFFGCNDSGDEEDYPPHCSDFVNSGDETDVDCGGSCESCENGSACEEHADCQSRFCDMGTCYRPEGS